MSTNATVTVFDGEKYHSIYVHWDGYITRGVGETLFNHYTDLVTIQYLIIDRPYISSLGITVADTLYSKTGEIDTEISQTFDMSVQLNDYDYLWKDGEWFVNIYNETDGFVKLSKFIVPNPVPYNEKLEQMKDKVNKIKLICSTTKNQNEYKVLNGMIDEIFQITKEATSKQ